MSPSRKISSRLLSRIIVVVVVDVVVVVVDVVVADVDVVVVDVVECYCFLINIIVGDPQTRPFLKDAKTTVKHIVSGHASLENLPKVVIH